MATGIDLGKSNWINYVCVDRSHIEELYSLRYRNMMVYYIFFKNDNTYILSTLLKCP